jgi:membrane-bound lytic murein transglycosylase MltF
MQLMPETCRELGVSDPFDPRQNILAGTRHLKSLFELVNYDLELALAAYKRRLERSAEENERSAFRRNPQLCKAGAGFIQLIPYFSSGSVS